MFSKKHPKAVKVIVIIATMALIATSVMPYLLVLL